MGIKKDLVPRGTLDSGNPAENDSRELAALQLRAVRGPRRPLSARDFLQLRRRARRLRKP